MKIINICGEYYWVTPLGEKSYPNLGTEIDMNKQENKK